MQREEKGERKEQSSIAKNSLGEMTQECGDCEGQHCMQAAESGNAIASLTRGAKYLRVSNVRELEVCS